MLLAVPMIETVITPDTLKRALARPGRSRTALAKALNLDASAVNRMVNGRRQIKASELYPIRKYLSETATELGGSKYLTEGTDSSTRATLQSLSLAASTDLGRTIASLTVKVVDSMVIALQPHIPFAAEERRVPFWEEVSNNADALILLCLGANIIDPKLADEIRSLIMLGQRIVESTIEDAKADSAVMSALQDYLGGQPLASDADQGHFRFAVKATSLALTILEGSQKASETLGNVARALERSLLATD